MLMRPTSPELDFEFASAFGAVSQPVPASANAASRGNDATNHREFRVNKLAVAALVAVVCLDSVIPAMAKQALATIAAAPASEIATGAMMLVGLVMIGFAARPSGNPRTPAMTAHRPLN